MEKKLFTSEAVSEGHPDKVCDQIADAILDACLEKDENARVACEVFATDNYILIGGEITCKTTVDYAQIARDVLKDIGYDKPEYGTDYHNVVIDVIITINFTIAKCARFSINVQQVTLAIERIAIKIYDC